MSDAGPPAADASVRLAWASDASALGGVTARALAACADLLPLPPEADDAEALARSWRQAVVRPPTARHRVLVALSAGEVVGLVATAPAEDPDSEPGVDGEVVALSVDPARTREGHGSRLLSAAADTLRADGFRRAQVWLLAADPALPGFLAGAGWAPDGAERQLDDGAGGRPLRQARWHTDLSEEE